MLRLRRERREKVTAMERERPKRRRRGGSVDMEKDDEACCVAGVGWLGKECLMDVLGFSLCNELLYRHCYRPYLPIEIV